jgi:hypothetical protein
MPTDFLDLELRLLVLKHGRSRLLQGLARMNDTSIEELEEQMRQTARPTPPRKPKPVHSAEESVTKLGLEGLRRDRVLTLAREFERGRFLPQLRDAVRFCAQNGTKPRAKSRRELLPRIAAVLATMPDVKLSALIDDIRDGGDGTSFARLAEAIMRGT